MQHYVPKPEEDIYELVMFMAIVQVPSVGDFLKIICVPMLIVVGGVERIRK